MVDPKLRKRGCSLVVTLPKQACDLLGWEEEDDLRIKIVDAGNFLIVNMRLENEKKEKRKDFFQG